jgi:hypothetical protein
MLGVHLPVQKAIHDAYGFVMLVSNMLLHEGETFKHETDQHARGHSVT